MIALYYRSRMQPWRMYIKVERDGYTEFAVGRRRWGFMWAARGGGEQTVIVSPVVEKLGNFKPLWADTAYGRIYFVPTARGDGERSE